MYRLTHRNICSYQMKKGDFEMGGNWDKDMLDYSYMERKLGNTYGSLHTKCTLKIPHLSHYLRNMDLSIFLRKSLYMKKKRKEVRDFECTFSVERAIY